MNIPNATTTIIPDSIPGPIPNALPAWPLPLPGPIPGQFLQAWPSPSAVIIP